MFHDLPEVLTRDIISPVKQSVEGLDDLIKGAELDMMKKEVYPLLPESWHSEMQMFAEKEFANFVTVDGSQVEKPSEEMNQFNEDRFNPRDGELVLACDHLAAFMEAHLALEMGLEIAEFQDAKTRLRERYAGKKIAGVDIGSVYADFSTSSFRNS